MWWTAICQIEPVSDRLEDVRLASESVVETRSIDKSYFVILMIKFKSFHIRCTLHEGEPVRNRYRRGYEQAHKSGVHGLFEQILRLLILLRLG